MARALVTGGLGFIGSHLVDRLVDDGHEVIIIDKSQTLPDRWHGELRIIRSKMQAITLPQADVIYHLAGLVGPALLKDGGYAEDILEAAWMLKRPLADGAKVIFTSTSETYGEQPNPLHEGLPRVFPAGAWGRLEYPAAKMMAEISLLNTGGDVRIIRPFNVAGPRQRIDGGFVLPRFFDSIRNDRPLTVYQPGTQHRAFTHVYDFVDGFIAAAERGYPGGIWNLGNPANDCTIMELAQEVIEVTGYDVGINVVDPRSVYGSSFSEAPDKVPDISKARDELGWEPTRDRRTTIIDAWTRS